MSVAHSMLELIERLYPICRSITGNGVRETLETMSESVDIRMHEVPSGTAVFDWTVPKEWNVRDAYIADRHGERVVDFQKHNLHLLNYSIPIRKQIPRDELVKHIHTLPEHPDWIPYRTSYYHENWGFCMSHRDAEAMRDSSYEVVVDTTLADGALTYGELLVPGKSKDEVLIYSHLCHPSLANDNLSGLAVTSELARTLESSSNRFSYRFVWGPGTIGSIVWLARNREHLGRIRHGLVAVLLGDRGGFNYKETRDGDREIDQIARHVVRHRGGQILPFDPYGYDERQFGSPGIRLPVGRFTRSPHGTYPEYHTSADNFDLISTESLAGSLDALLEIVDIIEHNRRYVNLQPNCEPQLGRRGLYRASGGESLPGRELAMLWTLNQSDGQSSLLDVADRAEMPFATIKHVAQELEDASLLKPTEPTSSTITAEALHRPGT